MNKEEILIQSKRWHMNMSLHDIIALNPKCQVDRSYKAHKYDDAYHGYCLYIQHPDADTRRTMIGIFEDGFTYIGDGLPYIGANMNNDLPLENTLEVMEEMLLYRNWLLKKGENKSRLMSQGIDYDDFMRK